MGQTLQQIAPHESADRLKSDQDAINKCIKALVALGNGSHSDLAVQMKIVDQAASVMNKIQQNASQATGALPDQSNGGAPGPAAIGPDDNWSDLYYGGDAFPESNDYGR